MNVITQVNPARVIKLNNLDFKKGDVVYWMSRDQRIHENWALTYAQDIALTLGVNLKIIFCLKTDFLGATLRQYDFMLKGLQEVEQEAIKYNIPFELLLGEPAKVIPKYCKESEVSCLITDFSPLRISKNWIKEIKESINCSFFQVDTHNIVPVWVTSNKQEFSARTIRPKIHKLLDEYLEDFPKLKKMKELRVLKNTDWSELYGKLNVSREIPPVQYLIPGYKQGTRTLEEFISKRIELYAENKNDPNLVGLSSLSPYLHFGQISPQYVALKTIEHDVFIEELVVRRELADNYCHYNEFYDSFEGFPNWAKKTLNEHRSDLREYTYTRKQLEYADTHDHAWNAAQNEMVNNGKMHGYMRMYWAKKLLEWAKDPEEALANAIYLNDKYEIDGRDPNGYAGIAWSIGGVHDRPWFERHIFGKIRYMNFNGLKRKFDVNLYIQTNSKQKL